MAALSRFPKRRFYGELMQSMLSSMESIWTIQDRMLDDDGYSGRRVLGFKLPVWQRLEVWDDDQCIKFIQSIYMGVGIGAYMVNYSASGKNDDTHLILLDGQQRLRAIERYWHNELAVPGDDGGAYLWSDLTKEEQAHFYRVPFPWVNTRYGTDQELREAYNRHNFGGVAHAPGQEA